MINDLPKRITSHPALYADDFCFWECGSDITLLNQLCQRSLTKVCKWCGDWFKLSSTICCCPVYKETQSRTYFLTSAGRYPPSTKKLIQVLSYSTHIQKVVAKCRARHNVIRLLKGTSWGAGKRPLLTVYRSLVISVIEYGMEAYFFTSPSLLKPLQKIQTDALRLCTGALVSTTVICLHHACNEMPLNIKHKFLYLKFKAHLLSFSDPLTEDCWQEHFPDLPGFCSFNMFTRLRLIIPFSPPLRCASRIFRLGRYKNPSSTSLFYSLSVRWHVHSLHRFSLRICTISMISLLKSIQTDQKPLNEPVAVYT